ncbi:hypothetical protein Sjap_008072 [Stephania japonica]|uniref:Uncharacterized protein n=1 Tax=Stephania japonica TaxID=461633 RepID=A0AAP0JQD0_9MAGN
MVCITHDEPSNDNDFTRGYMREMIDRDLRVPRGRPGRVLGRYYARHTEVRDEGDQFDKQRQDQQGRQDRHLGQQRGDEGHVVREDFPEVTHPGTTLARARLTAEFDGIRCLRLEPARWYKVRETQGGTKPYPIRVPPHGLSPPSTQTWVMRDKIPDFTSRVPLGWFSAKAPDPIRTPQLSVPKRDLSRGRKAKDRAGDTDGVGLGTTLPVNNGASGCVPVESPAGGLGWAVTLGSHNVLLEAAYDLYTKMCFGGGTCSCFSGMLAQNLERAPLRGERAPLMEKLNFQFGNSALPPMGMFPYYG